MPSITKTQAAKKLKRPYSTIAYWCRQENFTDDAYLCDAEFKIIKLRSDLAVRKSNKHNSRTPSRKLSGPKSTKRKAKKSTWIRADTVAIVIQSDGGELELVSREVFMQEWLDEVIQDGYPDAIFHEVSAISKGRTQQVMTLEGISIDDAKAYAAGA